MRVFLTGATGFIGSAIVPELIQAGHQVLGLTRSDAGAQQLRKAGAEVHRGDLEDLQSLRNGAANADAVIHTAFNHDFSRFAANCESDRQVIQALGEVLTGSDRPLIVTSGTGIAGHGGNGHIGLETDPPVSSKIIPRGATEEAVAAVADGGVRTMIVRLPQVHDTEKQGLVSYAIQIARQKGVSPYIGEGRNRWPAVPRFAAAELYRLVLEKGEAGKRYNAVAEEGVTMREIAEVVGKGLKVPVASISPEQAAEHFGWLAIFAGLDMPASSAWTQQALGWKPTGPSLIEDLKKMRYDGA